MMGGGTREGEGIKRAPHMLFWKIVLELLFPAPSAFQGS